MYENTSSRRTLSIRQGYNKKPNARMTHPSARVKGDSPALTGHELLLKKLQHNKIPVTIITVTDDRHYQMRIVDSDKYTLTLAPEQSDGEHEDMIVFKSAICEIHFHREDLNAAIALKKAE